MAADVAADLNGKVVAIDGKTMRGSFDKRRGQSPFHVVSAWVAESHVSLGQVVTDEKSNEITAIPALLKTVAITGATVTLDAMGCQKEIASAIVEKGADYILALKDNHPILRAEVETAFAYSKAVGVAPGEMSSFVETAGKKLHGRHETRTCTVITNLESLTDDASWKGLRSIVRVERTREHGGKVSNESAYYLSSLNVGAEIMGQRIRSHWSIENNLHWSLDVTLGEDQSRVRSRAGAANLAVLRKLTLGLLKREPAKAKKSMVKKQKIAGWMPDYAFDVLNMISRE
jgi:predicted transposase YbfD/YdcC